MRKKIALVGIHRRLMNVYGDQTVDVSTARQWVVRFSNGDSGLINRPSSGRALDCCQLSWISWDPDKPSSLNSDRYMATLTKL
jgi:hypothetical protein